MVLESLGYAFHNVPHLTVSWDISVCTFPWLRSRAATSSHRMWFCGDGSTLATKADSELASLSTWLKQRGEYDATLALEAGLSAEGRALFPQRPVKLGETVLRISKNLVISPQRLPESIADLLPEKLSGHGLLALFILIHQHARETSPWAPYIRCLPSKHELQSTIFWADDELELVRLSSVYTDTVFRKTYIEEEFASLRTVLDTYPHIFGQNVGIEAYRYAYGLAMSRSWGDDAVGSISMIPFADFLNHSADSRSMLLIDEQTGHAEVVADRDYSVGSQMCITYGHLGNSNLALGFGFTLPHNPHDEVNLWIQLVREDPLWKEKLELLHRHGLTTELLADGSESGGSWFKLREIPSPAGMGKGLPLELRAFARVMSCNTAEELRGMADDVRRRRRKLGQLPFKDNREGSAMGTLFARLDTSIKTYTTSINTAETAVSASKIGSPRGEMVATILKGELRVLWSVRAWLRPRIIVD